jgi:hypothetical protein
MLKKLVILFVLFFVFSILLSVNKDFNSKVVVKLGIEEVQATIIAPPPK